MYFLYFDENGRCESDLDAILRSGFIKIKTSSALIRYLKRKLRRNEIYNITLKGNELCIEHKDDYGVKSPIIIETNTLPKNPLGTSILLNLKQITEQFNKKPQKQKKTNFLSILLDNLNYTNLRLEVVGFILTILGIKAISMCSIFNPHSILGMFLSLIVGFCGAATVVVLGFAIIISLFHAFIDAKYDYTESKEYERNLKQKELEKLNKNIKEKVVEKKKVETISLEEIKKKVNEIKILIERLNEDERKHFTEELLRHLSAYNVKINEAISSWSKSETTLSLYDEGTLNRFFYEYLTSLENELVEKISTLKTQEDLQNIENDLGRVRTMN